MSFPTSTTVYGQIIIEDKIYNLLSQPLGDEQKKTNIKGTGTIKIKGTGTINLAYVCIPPQERWNE